MEVVINYDHGEEDLQSLPLLQLAEFVLEHQGKPDDTEVSISFVDDSEIARLNKQYREKDGPTDVLSFECDGLDDDFDDMGYDNAADVASAAEAAEGMQEANEIRAPFELGDIVIAPDVARRQTIEFGTTFEEEVSLLIVHGLLHLCGYDHIKDDEAEVMEARERELLGEWDQRR